MAPGHVAVEEAVKIATSVVPKMTKIDDELAALLLASHREIALTADKSRSEDFIAFAGILGTLVDDVLSGQMEPNELRPALGQAAEWITAAVTPCDLAQPKAKMKPSGGRRPPKGRGKR